LIFKGSVEIQSSYSPQTAPLSPWQTDAPHDPVEPNSGTLKISRFIAASYQAVAIAFDRYPLGVLVN
jgi:hypothetical protein